MEKSTTFSAPFMCSLLPSETKKLRLRISFRVKTTYIDNKYDLFPRTCSDESYIIEGVGITVSYAQVTVIRSLYVIIDIDSAEGLIIFILDI